MNDLVVWLKERGVKFGNGLSENELVVAEKAYGFHFPPDLREFLSIALPIDSNPEEKRIFPDWRNVHDIYTQEMIDWPKKSLKFDVEQNDFWLESLGVKPVNKDKQLEMLLVAFDRAPKLIPVCSHRFLPELPHESGNPIISFWQASDVIYYGVDLEDYFLTEWGERKWMSAEKKLKKIDFWSDVITS